MSSARRCGAAFAALGVAVVAGVGLAAVLFVFLLAVTS